MDGYFSTSFEADDLHIASQIFLSDTPDYSEDAQVVLSSVLNESGERSGIFAQLLEPPSPKAEQTQELDLGEEEDQAEDESAEDPTREGSETEEEKTSEYEPTKEDDKQYDKEKEAEGKDPDKMKSMDSGEGQGTYANQKPSKKPILKHGGEKLDLRKNRLFRRFAQMIPTGLAILDKEAEAL